MPIITLTSDLGLEDYYVAAIKGRLLSECKDLQLADISHTIQPHSIGHAAFVLRNSYGYFPNNTIHLICVNNEAYNDNHYLLALHKQHYFLAGDNGVFSVLFDGMPEKTFELNPTEKKTDTSFAFLDTLLPAACALANGEIVDSLARPVNSIRQMFSMQPSIGDDYIRANVLYVDHFENVILNVTKQQFETARQGRNFYLSFRRNEYIDHISKGYANAIDGEKLCLFNSAGYLEIAINRGKASSLLGLNEGESVKIEFQMIVRIVKMTFAPEKVNDFLHLFSKVKVKISSFKGCNHLELLQDTKAINIYFTYSIWDDEKALDHYRFSELFKETWSKTKPLFSEKAEAWSLESVVS